MEVNISKQLYFLERIIHSNVAVSVNTSAVGVIVPEQFYKEPHIKLEIGWFMPFPAKNLRVNRQGIRVELTFNRTPFMVSLPWYSIFQLNVMGDHEYLLWLPDAPVTESAQGSIGIVGPPGVQGDHGEPTTVSELVAGTGAEPKDNVIHVDFGKKKAPIVDAVIEDEKEPA